MLLLWHHGFEGMTPSNMQFHFLVLKLNKCPRRRPIHPFLRSSSNFLPTDILLDLSQRLCSQAKSVAWEDVDDAGTKDTCDFLSFIFSLASAVVHRRHSEPKLLVVPFIRGHCCLMPPAGCLIRIQYWELLLSLYLLLKCQCIISQSKRWVVEINSSSWRTRRKWCVSHHLICRSVMIQIVVSSVRRYASFPLTPEGVLDSLSLVPSRNWCTRWALNNYYSLILLNEWIMIKIEVCISWL